MKLKELCNVTSSKRIFASQYQNSGIPFYRGKEISLLSNNEKIKQELYISEELYQEINKKYGVPKKDDILMTAVGTIGNCYIIKDEKIYFKDGNIIWLKDIDSKKILPKYLYYCLNLNSTKNTIDSLLIGSTQKALTIENFKNIEIDVPNIEIQSKIVKLLNILNNKIRLNIKINNNLQALINSIFKRWFIDFEFPNGERKLYKSSNGKMIDSELGEIPEEWKIIIFKDIIDFSNGYSIDSKKMLDKEVNNTYKVFKMGNINPLGGINKDKTKSWLSKEYCNGLEKYISKKGDILMCMTDMKNSDTPLLGHTALIDKDNEFIINQRVGIIRCKKELVNYPFVYTLTNLDFFVKNIRSRANSGVQVNLSTKGICDTPLILPDRKTLDKFNDIAEPMYEEIFRNNEENETLSKLRDTLLPKLMNGEIDLDKIEI